jgi:hypothetical protein
MIWKFGIAALVIGTLLVAYSAGVFRRRRLLRHVREHDRQMSYDEAISKVEQGNGVLVEDSVLLPGAVWWLPSDIEPHEELFDAVNDNGWLLTDATSDRMKEARADQTTVESIRSLDAEPFID